MKVAKGKIKYLVINVILFAILYFSVLFNKTYIRPVFGDSPILGIITGSFPNFMAAYIISLFPITPVFLRKITINKSRILIYTVAFVVFLILTMEEIKPFFDASKVWDIYDILSSGLGSIFAIVTFEILYWKYRAGSNSENI